MVKRYYDAGKEVIKFLNSLRNLVKSKGIRTPEQAYEFARSEFGKIPALLKKQIDDIFKKKDVAKPTKKGELVPIKKKIDLSKYDDAALNALAAEGNRIKTRLDELGKSGTNYDEFKKLSARKKEIDDILSAAQDVPASGIGSFKADMELAKISGKAKKKTLSEADVLDLTRKKIDTSKPIMGGKNVQGTYEEKIDWLVKNVSSEGEVGIPPKATLEAMLKDGRGDLIDHFYELYTKKLGKPKIKIDTSDLKHPELVKKMMMDEKLKPTLVKGLDPREGVVRAAAREILNKNKIKIGKEDPIEVLRKTYGEDALEAVDAIGDDLLNTQTYGEVNDLLTKHKLFDFKPKKVFGYDQNVVSAEKIRKAKEQEAKHKKMLEDWDPDREPSAHGGIAGQLHLNRTGYFAGRLVKGYELGKAFWKLLKDPKKIRAAVDNIFPTGDYKYDAEMAAEALVELNPKVFGGKLIDDLDDATRSEVYGAVIGPIQQQALVISKMKKARATADEITKGVADVMQDTSKAGLARSIEVDNLKLEFPGITDDMINKILVDDNPQRIAEIKATIKEVMKMREKGMGSNEIIQMFRKTPRTKNAEGGLINILKL
jgi:hypothetical protein